MKAMTRRIWYEAGIIFALGVVLGLAVNIQMVIDAFAGRLTSEQPAVTADGKGTDPAGEETGLGIYPVPVLLDEVRELLKTGAVLIDARAVEVYDAGHLPQAVSLPAENLYELLADFVEQVPIDTTLIVYCSGFGCPDSENVAEGLLDEGYTDVRVYEGGFPEWRDSGLAVAKGAP